MTVDLLPAPASTPAATDDDTEWHYSCCDPDIMMCGLHLPGPDEERCGPAPECKICRYITDEALPCPVPGCPYGAP